MESGLSPRSTYVRPFHQLFDHYSLYVCSYIITGLKIKVRNWLAIH